MARTPLTASSRWARGGVQQHPCIDEARARSRVGICQERVAIRKQRLLALVHRCISARRRRAAPGTASPAPLRAVTPEPCAASDLRYRPSRQLTSSSIAFLASGVFRLPQAPHHNTRGLGHAGGVAHTLIAFSLIMLLLLIWRRRELFYGRFGWVALGLLAGALSAT